MEDDIFLMEQNPVSKRWVIFDESENIAYLYLTERESQHPRADVVVYAKEIVHHDAMTAPIRRGQPPLLTLDYASVKAIRTDIHQEDISFIWSPKGNAVAVCIRGEPTAFISANGSRTFSRAIARKGPYGEPWSSAGFEVLFGESLAGKSTSTTEAD